MRQSLEHRFLAATARQEMTARIWLWGGEWAGMGDAGGGREESGLDGMRKRARQTRKVQEAEEEKVEWGRGVGPRRKRKVSLELTRPKEREELKRRRDGNAPARSSRGERRLRAWILRSLTLCEQHGKGPASVAREAALRRCMPIPPKNSAHKKQSR